MGKAAADQSPDGQVIVQLVKAGSKLTKVHPIEFYFYFPTKEAAHRVAAKLMADGFSAQVNYSAYKGDWLIFATKAMLPDEAQLLVLRQKFETMASEEKGEYDGWGTPVVE